MENLPTFIQVGMGTAVSSRRLAQAVSQLGVVSGTALSMSSSSLTNQKTPTSGEGVGVTHFIPYPRVEFAFETEFVSRASNSRRVSAGGELILLMLGVRLMLIWNSVKRSWDLWEKKILGNAGLSQLNLSICQTDTRALGSVARP